MQFKLAILTVLATRPDGRATLDELKGEVEALTADDDPSDEIASALDEIDVFQSGLVIPEDDGLRITDAGRFALNALEASSQPSFDLPSPSASPSLEMIDQLIGTEERLKIFDLELRAADIDGVPDRAEEVKDAEHIGNIASASTTPVAAQEADDDLIHESMARPAPPIGGAALSIGEPDVVARKRPERPDAPAILVRDLDSEARAPARAPPRRGTFGSAITARFRRARSVWQRHLERDAANTKPVRRAGNGGAIALLTLLVLVICAGAVIALTQIRSLKSEVAALQRELSPLRERAARADFLEKAKQIADQHQNSAAEKNKAARPEQAALSLTQEEIRMIRDFIKPAPAAATAAPAINVGDTVGIATLPLPSLLMDKIPKLLGARFTTRNGSIIILRRDSRQADVVLPPN